MGSQKEVKIEETKVESQNSEKLVITEMVFTKSSIYSDESEEDDDNSFSESSTNSGPEEESFLEEWDVLDYTDYIPEWTEATEEFKPSSTLPKFKKRKNILKKNLSHLESPVQFFEELLPQSIVSNFTNWTNEYAEKKRHRKRRESHEKKWEKATDSKVRAFLGMLLLLPLVQKPRLKDYWSNSVLTDTPAIKNIMSRDDFQQMKSNMRFYDENNYDGKDVFHKTRPLIDVILKNTNDVYSAPKNLSLDESMIKYNGRSKCKVFMPLKPIKFGFKVYSLTASEEPVILNLQIYDGESQDITTIVTNLLIPFANEGHCVYMDRLVT